MPLDADRVTTRAAREPLDAGRALSIAGAVFFAAIGILGLARSGIVSPTAPQASIAGLEATPVLSFIHLAVGLLAAAGATGRAAARGILLFLGACLILLGVAALSVTVSAFGWGSGNGAAYLIVGIVFVGGALATAPAPLAERRTAVR